MGYHKTEIKKGGIGEFSKIEEEFQELLDAHTQNAKILELCEIADLYGAIEIYIKVKFGMSMDDIKTMSNMTKEAFLSGERK